MSKKYIPPYLREEMDDLQEKKERFTTLRPTYSSKGAVENLVNTSQAAKEVAPLAPMTVFSGATRKLQVHVPSSSDFPTIGVPTIPRPVAGPWGQKSFADLSKDWAAKQKEELEQKKKEDQMNALLAAERHAQKEKEEKEKKALRALHLAAGTQRNDESDDEKYDLGGVRDRGYGLEEEESSDSYVEEDDAEDEIDDTWERSRNKHDYY